MTRIARVRAAVVLVAAGLVLFTSWRETRAVRVPGRDAGEGLPAPTLPTGPRPRPASVEQPRAASTPPPMPGVVERAPVARPPALEMPAAAIPTAGPAAMTISPALQSPATGGIAPGTAPGAPIIAQYDVRIMPPFREQLEAAISGPADGRLRFPVSAGRTLDLVITHRDEAEAGRGTVYARVEDQAASSVVLAYVNEAVAGTILTPTGELFQVRYAGDGVHRISQLDPQQFPNEAESPDLPALDRGQAGAAGRPAAPGGRIAGDPFMRADAAEGAEPSSPVPFEPVMQADAQPLPGELREVPDRDGDTVVDLMVLYTPETRVRNGGATGMRATIDAAVATSNLAFSNSQIAMQLRLVYAGEVSYTSSSNLGTDLSRLAQTSDGTMDSIHALRAQYSADLVSLFVPPSNDGAAGVGYLLNATYGASYMYQYGFTTVVDIYADSNLTLAHEIGHNLGASHAASDPGGSTPLFADSVGYRFTASGQTYRTVMAYAPGIRIPYFSTPGLTYLGAPLGTSTANNARVLRYAKRVSAAGRESITDWTLSLPSDLNQDGKADMVWRNLRSGRVVSWLMNGGVWTSTPSIWEPATATDADWIAMTSADVNADGQTDLIWRHADSGRVIVWYMNGTTRIGTAPIWPATNPGDADWVPMAAGDFNGDTRPDIVWRNASTGRVIVWYMNGATRTGTAAIWPATNPGDAAWIPMASADFNADGKPDLIWRNATTGRVIIWFMDGVTRTGTAAIWTGTNPGDSSWRPIGTGDFNSDGHPDIVWRNATSGQVIVWLMNGAGCIGSLTIWS